MKFYSGYHPMNDLYGPMDRGFYQGGDAEAPSGATIQGSPAASGAENLGMNIKDVGMSVPMGIAAPNVQGIYGKIRSGVSKLEIGFPGAISGNRQAHTPEMYGKDQRQAMRELAMVNDVEYTTHAAYQIMGMTGAIEQGSDLVKFDMNRARMAQQEVERAIDFASDVARGGSVVVHTGEYDRPLTDMWLRGNNLSKAEDGRIMFKQRLTEDKDAKFFLIDDRTGQAMSQVEKDRLVAFPEWKRYNPNAGEWKNHGGKQYRDENGNIVTPNDYIDYRGNKVEDPFDPVKGRVPIFDEDNRRFKVHYMSYDDFKREAEEKNKYFEIKNGRKPSEYEKVTQTEAFLQATLETNEGHSRGWAGQYSAGVKDELDTLNKLKKAAEFYGQLDDTIPASEKWKIAVKESKLHSATLQQLIPPDTKQPIEVLRESIKDMEARVLFSRQASASQEQQAWDTAETKRHIKDPLKYVERFAVRGYAESAIHAMDRSIDPERPIFIAMENIFPERFGGHPQELKWLIEKAREKFVDYLTNPTMELGTASDKFPTLKKNENGELQLQQQPNPFYRPGISKEEAAKRAEMHIKATIDTGHLNMWRKYFQPAMGSTPEKNEEEFRKWWTTQIEDLAKNKIIGNVHLTDNYGYQDDHLAPGQGNTPVKETVEILKKYGYDKAWTVEPGADASTDVSDFHGLMKTWRYFGSPIYGMGAGGGGRRTWGDVQYSYFGQDKPPYFVFGSYSPSNDWTLWSQVPME